MKNFLQFLCLICLFFFVVPTTHAASPFSTAYNVTYQIGKDGGADVSMEITIKNNTAEYYAADFTLKIPESGITDIKGVRNKKDLPLKTEIKEDNLEVYVQFLDQVVGKGKNINFNVTYKAKDIGKIKGNNLEVILPGLGKDYPGDYQMQVQIPKSRVGEHQRVQPEPSSQTSDDINTIFTFGKDRLTDQTIIMNFGDSQTYDMSLIYYLKNTSSSTRARAEIALPPSTEYQTVVYESLEPRPKQINLDGDGNYIAQYILNPNEEIEVQAKTKVIVSAAITNNLPPISDDQISKYLTAQEYWDVDAPEIQNLSQQYQTPEAIYNFVIEKLSYAKDRRDIASLRRQGSLEALVNPDEAVCMEFTDLFIAIARAAGIPAREVNGYGFTENQEKAETLFADNFHAWPEYYDQKQQRWIQVDPTWGDTTGGINYFSAFDTNHITFIRRGISSTSPVGAGAYFRNESDKTVFVSYASNDANPNREIKATLNDEVLLSGFPDKTTLTLENIGNVGYIGTIQSIFTPKGIINPITQPIHLPPYAQTQTDFSLDVAWNHQTVVQASVIDDASKPLVKGLIQSNPLYLHPYTLLAAGYLFALMIILILFKRFIKHRA